MSAFASGTGNAVAHSCLFITIFCLLKIVGIVSGLKSPYTLRHDGAVTCSPACGRLMGTCHCLLHLSMLTSSLPLYEKSRALVG